MQTNKGFSREKNTDATFQKGRNYLFIIGIDLYKNIGTLKNAVRDAKTFKEILINQYQFKKKYVIELYDSDATFKAIDRAFRLLSKKISAIDNLIIFFSGHGHYDDFYKEGYWVPVEAKFGEISDYYPYEYLTEALKNISSRHTFVIADSCYSGAVLVQKTRKIKEIDPREIDPSRWILASGRNEVVSDGIAGENSPFAKQLFSFLTRYAETGISVISLVEKVTTATIHNEVQKPIGRPIYGVGDQGGQFFFHAKSKDINTNQEKLNIISDTKSLKKESSEENGNRNALYKERENGFFENKSFLELISALVLLGGIVFLGVKLLSPDKSGIPITENKRNFLPIDTTRIAESYVVDSQKHMVYIQGGKYSMGDSFNYGDIDELPIHSVFVNNFLIARTEVSFQDYDKYCDEFGIEKPSDNGWGRGKMPAINITWLDAVKYCNWLSKGESLERVYSIFNNQVDVNWSADGYRLPTEAEWELAASGLGKSFVFGNSKNNASPEDLNFNSEGLYKKAYSQVGILRGKPIDVDSLAKNNIGLIHMSGNVWEWCQDWYNKNYYSVSVSGNPHGPSSGFNKVLKGGGWNSRPEEIRINNRSFLHISDKRDDLGFRVVRSNIKYRTKNY